MTYKMSEFDRDFYTINAVNYANDLYEMASSGTMGSSMFVAQEILENTGLITNPFSKPKGQFSLTPNVEDMSDDMLQDFVFLLSDIKDTFKENSASAVKKMGRVAMYAAPEAYTI